MFREDPIPIETSLTESVSSIRSRPFGTHSAMTPGTHIVVKSREASTTKFLYKSICGKMSLVNYVISHQRQPLIPYRYQFAVLELERLVGIEVFPHPPIQNKSVVHGGIYGPINGTNTSTTSSICVGYCRGHG